LHQQTLKDKAGKRLHSSKFFSKFVPEQKTETMTVKAMYQQAGFSYLGNVNHSRKMAKGKTFDVMTYSVYLASSDSSGYNVCPMANVFCKNACLNYSGHGRYNRTQKARIRKTRLFFENRDLFMKILFHEIAYFKKRAAKKGLSFAVRFNATSDINLKQLKLDGLNVLEQFPDIQFYDYTKVYKYLFLANEYENLDMTFSYSGENWNECENALQNGFRVSAIFEKELPETFKGYPVIDGDQYDMRYFDPNDVIVGLRVKKVSSKELNQFNENPFFVPYNHPDRVNLETV
jgi:hypothetical protein